MINPRDIDSLISDYYEDNPRYQQTWGSDDFEPVDDDYDGESVEYMLTEEGKPLRIENVGLLEHVTNGGINHDGGEIYQVVKFTDLDGNSENFIRTGWYSSWDSNQYGSWSKAEEYTFTEQRWRAAK
jgi:hypothetical protein